MSSIELKPCPFCGKGVLIAEDNHDKVLIECENCNLLFGVEVEDGTELVEGWRATFDSAEEAIRAWNRRADNKPIRQSCKTCKYYTPDPNYRNGDMGNCRYLAKIWEKPYYVNEARTECDHFQAAERINENGNET